MKNLTVIIAIVVIIGVIGAFLYMKKKSTTTATIIAPAPIAPVVTPDPGIIASGVMPGVPAPVLDSTPAPAIFTPIIIDPNNFNASSDVFANGSFVAVLKDGAFLQFDNITLPTPGTYTFSYEIATGSGSTGSNVSTSLIQAMSNPSIIPTLTDGSTVISGSPLGVIRTGGTSAYKTISQTVNVFLGGTYSLKLGFSNPSNIPLNIDKITISQPQA